MEHILPREIQNRVQKAADEVAQQISQNIVSIVDNTAQKQVPKVAREKLPDLAQTHLEVIAESSIPKLVNSIIGREGDKEFDRKINPVVKEATRRIRKKVNLFILVMLILVFLGLAANFYFYYISPRIARDKPVLGLFEKK